MIVSCVRRAVRSQNSTRSRMTGAPRRSCRRRSRPARLVGRVAHPDQLVHERLVTRVGVGGAVLEAHQVATARPPRPERVRLARSRHHPAQRERSSASTRISRRRAWLALSGCRSTPAPAGRRGRRRADRLVVGELRHRRQLRRLLRRQPVAVVEQRRPDRHGDREVVRRRVDAESRRCRTAGSSALLGGGSVPAISRRACSVSDRKVASSAARSAAVDVEARRRSSGAAPASVTPDWCRPWKATRWRRAPTPTSPRRRTRRARPLPTTDAAAVAVAVAVAPLAAGRRGSGLAPVTTRVLLLHLQPERAGDLGEQLGELRHARLQLVASALETWS